VSLVYKKVSKGDKVFRTETTESIITANKTDFELFGNIINNMEDNIVDMLVNELNDIGIEPTLLSTEYGMTVFREILERKNVNLNFFIAELNEIIFLCRVNNIDIEKLVGLVIKNITKTTFDDKVENALVKSRTFTTTATGETFAYIDTAIISLVMLSNRYNK